MSHIDDLINELAPKGVPFKTLSELGTITRGKRFVKSDIVESGVPCIHYGEIYMKYGTSATKTFSYLTPDQAARLRSAHPGDVIVASAGETIEDIGKAVAWLGDEDVVIHDACYAFRSKLEAKYVVYFFQTDDFHNQIRKNISSSKISAISTENLGKVRIPVPPTQVQQEIVRILDDFADSVDELAAALSSESELRRSQYSKSREALLNRQESATVEGSRALADLVEFTNGKPHERLVSTNGTVALLTARFISTSGKSARLVNEGDALTPALRGDIAMVMSDLPNGRALARCFYVEEDGKYSANQRVCLLRVRDERNMSARWLYHFLDRNPQLLAYDNGQDQTHLKKGQILGIQVPLIPLAEQERIVAILDRLDVSMRELVTGLQVEREARRKQYEHYRDRLVSFKELAA